MAYFGKAATGPGSDNGPAPPGVSREVLKAQQQQLAKDAQALADAAAKAARRAAVQQKAKNYYRWDLINKLLKLSDGRRYLEIGVRDGKCASRVHAAERWGVDPEPRGDAQKFYQRFEKDTSDRFFERLPSAEQFDVIFIDGLHHAEQVHRDASNALRHLAPGGAIVLHDCNPQSEAAQRVPQSQAHWNGDCWKAAVELRKRSDLSCHVVNHDEGLGLIFPRRTPSPGLSLPKSGFELTYDELVRDRGRLLGLVPWERIESLRSEAWKEPRLTVVTALYGTAFALHEPHARWSGVDMVCFTEQSRASTRWTIERMPVSGLSPRRANRRVKALVHRYVEGPTLYVDAEYGLVGDPRDTIGAALVSRRWAATKHPARSCLYEEGEHCIAVRRCENAAVLQGQLSRYRAQGMPTGYGLWAGGILARDGSEEAKQFGEAWWDEIARGSERDQVSLAYVSWKLGMKPSVLPGNYKRIAGLERRRVQRGYP